jgi:Flp pilus assembly pilin Flp
MIAGTSGLRPRRQSIETRGGAWTMAVIRSFLACESGSPAIEYALIAALVGLGLVLSLTNLKDNFGTFTNSAINGLAGR